MTSGTITITARTLDLAREALDRVTVTRGGEGVVVEARWREE